MIASSGSVFQSTQTSSIDIPLFASCSPSFSTPKQRRQRTFRGASRLPLLLLVIIAFIVSPAVSVPFEPHFTRSDLELLLSTSRSNAHLSGEIVSDDHQRESPLALQRAQPINQEQHDSNNDSNNNDEASISQIISVPSSTPRRRSSDLPTAFDTSISENSFSSNSCYGFFYKFTSNTTVTDCYAVSMLLRDSDSFFQTLHSAAETSRLLDLACSASVSHCSSIMSSLASELLSDKACGKDYEEGNSIVTDAYTDMIAYEPVYDASCLKSSTTGDYCFVDAVSNSTNAADYDVYFMPLGELLPGNPTCNECLQSTMAVYSHWAQVDGQPLDQTYLPAASKVNSKCGSGYATTNITTGADKAVTSAGWSTATPNLSLYWMGCILTFSVALLDLF